MLKLHNLFIWNLFVVKGRWKKTIIERYACSFLIAERRFLLGILMWKVHGPSRADLRALESFQSLSSREASATRQGAQVIRT